MRVKRNDVSWYKIVLYELKKMHEKKEISLPTYQEMKQIYEEKLKVHLEEEKKDLELKLKELKKEIATLGAGASPMAHTVSNVENDKTRIYK